MKLPHDPQSPQNSSSRSLNWLLAAAASMLLLFVACTSTPEAFEDPRGDFSLKYPSDWEDTTANDAAEWAKRSNDYHIAFGATKFVSDDREGRQGFGIVSRKTPVAWFMVKRGSNISAYWSGTSSDRDFLKDWVGSIGRDTEPTATNFGIPIEVNHGGVVGMEMETTYSKTISLRRFFRPRGDTILEVICASLKGRWGSERKECQELLEAVEIGQ